MKKAIRTRFMELVLANPDWTPEQAKKALKKEGIPFEQWFYDIIRDGDIYYIRQKIYLTKEIRKIYLPGMSKEETFEKLEEKGFDMNKNKGTKDYPNATRLWYYLNEAYKLRLKSGHSVRK